MMWWVNSQVANTELARYTNTYNNNNNTKRLLIQTKLFLFLFWRVSTYWLITAVEG
jgi:hypothetical protein